MRFLPVCLLLLLTTATVFSQPLKSFDITLKNGMKIISCEKPGNDYIEFQVWYRVGSKDEKPGIRGMAHLFEHMMFRGTVRHPGNSVFKKLDSAGAANINAYTSYDRTVYHETVQKSALELAFDLESDRMANFTVTQEILDTEREVVGEELRIGMNSWYQKMISDRYPYLYPGGHPYEVDVIGFLEEITAFKAQQCIDFFDNYYSPNNAFLVVVGDVKHEEVFQLAEQYFGKVTKQVKMSPRKPHADLVLNKVKQTEMEIAFPVQIYSYVFPRPASRESDFLAVNLLTEMLFTDQNSILQNRLVKKEMTVYGIQKTTDDWNLFANYAVIDFIMEAAPGNVKVKKAVKEELDKIRENGIPQEMIIDYVNALENQFILRNYDAGAIAVQLGIMEYYFRDHTTYYRYYDMLRKIKTEDIKRVANTWFKDENLQLINIKPGME